MNYVFSKKHAGRWGRKKFSLPFPRRDPVEPPFIEFTGILAAYVLKQNITNDFYEIFDCTQFNFFPRSALSRRFISDLASRYFINIQVKSLSKFELGSSGISKDNIGGGDTLFTCDDFNTL